jgi:hypothetical protein
MLLVSTLLSRHCRSANFGSISPFRPQQLSSDQRIHIKLLASQQLVIRGAQTYPTSFSAWNLSPRGYALEGPPAKRPHWPNIDGPRQPLGSESQYATAPPDYRA